MTNQEQIQTLIDAGKKATQGEWKFIGKSCTCNNCGCGYDVYAGEWNEKSNSEKEEDAKFITQAANSRPALSAMLEENKRLREALKGARNGLEWYRTEHPEDRRDADYEMDYQIKQALEGSE